MSSLFNQVSAECSKLTTERYSTSFSSSIRMLHKDLHTPIYNIYGFVRFADEIVDSFHSHDKYELLEKFKIETYESFNNKISLNPILNSFQLVVNEYNIDIELVDAFFASMSFDLNKKTYDEEEYKKYIYGSAEVVGLMCLYVFCNGNEKEYQHLKPYAKSLGAAFQKVNFLRDVKADSEILKRTYFPGIDFTNFSDKQKKQIEDDIENDFKNALEGIKQLPIKARLGVYVAYCYYLKLFQKITKLKPAEILEQRIRIPDVLKAVIVFNARIKTNLNILN